jgi:hypothetical protein
VGEVLLFGVEASLFHPAPGPVCSGHFPACRMPVLPRHTRATLITFPSPATTASRPAVSQVPHVHPFFDSANASAQVLSPSWSFASEVLQQGPIAYAVTGRKRNGISSCSLRDHDRNLPNM